MVSGLRWRRERDSGLEGEGKEEVVEDRGWVETGVRGSGKSQTTDVTPCVMCCPTSDSRGG